jgi:hypothetical protein
MEATPNTSTTGDDGQQQQQQAAAWKPAFADDGVTFAPDWLKGAPDEWKDVAGAFDGVKDLRTAGERIRGLRQSLSAKGIIVPGEKATDEEKAAFLAELDKHRGVPGSPDDYGDLKPAERNDAIPWDDTLAKDFAALAPKLGLTKSGAAELVKWFDDRTGAQVAELQGKQDAEAKAETDKLVADYGERLDSAVQLVQGNPILEKLGWKPEKFDPRSPEFVGPQAFKLVHSLAEELAKARGGDATRGTSGSGSKGEGIAWAKAISDGTNKELAEVRKLPIGTPRRDDLERRIAAAWASGIP